MRSKQQVRIEQQADRNRRLRKVKPGERRRIKKRATAVYGCDACDRKVCIPWSEIEGTARPRCKICDQPLTLVTACLNKGVLPRA
jgi:hypothetical protein